MSYSDHWILCTGCTVCLGRRKRRRGHLQASRPGTQTKSPSDPLPWRIRAQQTGLGILVYGLVAALIWPNDSGKAFTGSVSDLVSTQRQLYQAMLSSMLALKPAVNAVVMCASLPASDYTDVGACPWRPGIKNWKHPQWLPVLRCLLSNSFFPNIHGH
jgi:hypothetical protein